MVSNRATGGPQPRNFPVPFLTCMSFVIAMAEVEASDVHAGIDELFDCLDRPTGGPHGADNLHTRGMGGG